MVKKLRDKCRLLVALVLVAGLCLPATLTAAVNARLNSTKIYVGDLVTLEIMYEGKSSVQPDLSPLGQDFDILGTGTGSQVQVINGNRRERRTWSIRLLPKKQGLIDVPPISLGAESTPKLQLEVVDIPQGTSTSAQTVFIEAEVEESSVYVQQQIHLVNRLYHQAPILAGEWSEPTIENAVIELLGNGREYQVTRDGRVYNVMERRYAVFPERSGELVIAPSRFSGQIATPNRRQAPQSGRRSDPRVEQFFGFDPFDDDFFNRDPFSRSRGKEVRALGEALTVDVKTVPSDLEAPHWVPASAVTFTDSWREAPPDFSKGQPVARSITVEAKGLAASQLPALLVEQTPSAGIYAEAPVTSTRTDGKWVFARSKQTITYVPHANGNLVIPEISLAWWNTEADKPEVTTLQSWNVVVSGIAESEQEQDIQETPSIEEAQRADGEGVAKSEPIETEALSDKSHSLAYVGLLALLIVGVVAYWFVTRRSSKNEMNSKEAELSALGQDNKSSLLKQLNRACAQNDAAQARELVLQLSQQQWPREEISSLEGVSTKVPEAKEELFKLDRHLFGQMDRPWDGSEFWISIKDIFVQAQSAKISSNSTLKPLYPD